jgi:DDE superfamily endonuclease
MNPPKINEYDYIDFLIGTQQVYSCTEAARVQAEVEDAPAHDAITRLIQRLFPSTERLWQEAKEQVDLTTGILIVDDSTLDKWYSRNIELVTRHWSGKHKQVVLGINLVTLLWTDGERYIPIDYRIYHKKQDGLTKNDHFQQMLYIAHQRGFRPACVCFDSWYASLKNLKLVARLFGRWLTRLETDRLVNPDKSGNRPLASVNLASTGTIVHLKGFGFIKVFKIVVTENHIEYWASNDLQMNELTRLKFAQWSWMIETYHRGIKQFCGIEQCQARSATAQRNHIELALRAFLRLEFHSFVKGISWFEAKTSIIRAAVRAYLANPTYVF